MTTAKYKNPWYDPTHGHDPAVYITDVKPVEYRGYKIYQRMKGVCWDVVKDGVCIGQRCGKSGAISLIDLIHDKPKDFWAERALGFLKDAA
jgi:hypothetical protein